MTGPYDIPCYKTLSYTTEHLNSDTVIIVLVIYFSSYPLDVYSTAVFL